MMKISKKTKRNAAKPAAPGINLIRASFAGLLISLFLVVAAAFLLQKQVLSIDSVNILNPIIKAISAILASLVGVHGLDRRKFLFGGLSGLCYMVLTTAVFALMDGKFALSTSLLTYAALCSAAGMVGGILCGLSK